MSMAFTFELDGAAHAVTIDRRRPELVLGVDERRYVVRETATADADCVELCVDGNVYRVWRTWEGDRIHLRIDGRSWSVGYEDAITAAQHQAGGDDILRADMPGVVVGVHCESGDAVCSGDALMVIESMKMQINIVAPRDGVVDAVHVETNEAFDKGAVLISLHAED